MASEARRWLMLVHQVAPSPAYLRVKVGRRLRRIGALALKNTVYVLPKSDAALEDLQWVLREIVADGGEATLCETRLVDGLTDAEVERRFHDDREAAYAEIARDARDLADELPTLLGVDDPRRGRFETEVARLERRLGEISAIDFFDAPGRESATGLVAELRARLHAHAQDQPAPPSERPVDYQGRTWVTRKGVHVDRIACAWLIRRFVDPDARLKFVDARGYRPEPGELRFDMFEAEFTHEGDLSSFEVLCRRLGLDAPGLQPIGEIVHDIDLKDGKFGRAEAPGIAATIAGIGLLEREDEKRLERGFRLFDELLAVFARKARPTASAH